MGVSKIILIQREYKIGGVQEYLILFQEEESCLTLYKDSFWKHRLLSKLLKNLCIILLYITQHVRMLCVSLDHDTTVSHQKPLYT